MDERSARSDVARRQRRAKKPLRVLAEVVASSQHLHTGRLQNAPSSCVHSWSMDRDGKLCRLHWLRSRLLKRATTLLETRTRPTLPRQQLFLEATLINP